ncbi:MAG: hypothetical protein JWP46_4325 [Modestobacter sp.]|jgi:hypothetical protein|nr:hypothetical protein [Modestobacter sp.]
MTTFNRVIGEVTAPSWSDCGGCGGKKSHKKSSHKSSKRSSYKSSNKHDCGW